MPKLIDYLRSVVIEPVKVQWLPHAGRKGTQPRDVHQHHAKACQSLCLGCDARTPCTLGRLSA